MNIIINRGKVAKLEELPKYSIALDGYVAGPMRDNKYHRYSLDHHAGSIRDCTLSCAQQAWSLINLGLETELYTLYCNDADLDVCLAVWCFFNPSRCHEPLVTKLVQAVGYGDMFLGALDHLSNGMIKVVKWIASPELESKRQDDYYKISDEGLHSVMEAVLHHIDLYVNGEAQTEIDKYHYKHEYKILQNYDSWVLVESKDPHVFSKLFQSGFNRIMVIRYLPDQSIAVSIAKKGDIVDGLDLIQLVTEYNFLEEGWGGGSTIIGAVRHHDGSRSHLSLDTIVATMNNHVQRQQSIQSS